MVSSCIFSQTKSIKEIATKFYSTYEIYALDYPAVFFEKRKTNWKVTTKKIVNGEAVNEKSYVFYNITDGKYQKLPFSLRTDKTPVDYKNYIDEYSEKNYKFHQFYGYNGWYKDVIASVSAKKILSDSALYSLARAYSMYASCLLVNQSGDAIKSEVFTMPFTSNCITAKQLALYDSVMKLSIQHFAKLAMQNKKFETTVGNIAIKKANEAMVQFHSYLTYAADMAAKYTLPNNLYPDSVISKTKAILQKCPTNAILFSWGDNDFYPVLYVQHQLGFRKDVYLINQSLLNLDRYILTATQPQFNSTAIQITAQQEDYKGSSNDYFLIAKDKDSTILLNDVIAYFKTGEKNSSGVVTLPANTISIHQNDIQENTTINTKLVKLDASILTKGDWILLDILNNLNGRKFCTTSTFFYPLKGLNEHFTMVDEDFYIY